MSIISYAQNFEDVMLFRALKHVKQGFYVDVGACHPVEHSVTKAFYDRGWQGINIEPVASYFETLCQMRDGDINIQALAWSHRDHVPFFEVKETGLSTTDAAHAKAHAARGFEVIEGKAVALPLRQLFEHYQVQEVHFLKIDVEGSELQVIEGIDFAAVKPWIIVVEATEPLSSEPAWSTWEPHLVDNGYLICYFDGLNRFYLSSEHAELSHHFRTPPNTFDNYKSYEEHQMNQHMRICDDERAQMEQLLIKQQATIDYLLEQLSCYSSRSIEVVREQVMKSIPSVQLPESDR